MSVPKQKDQRTDARESRLLMLESAFTQLSWCPGVSGGRWLQVCLNLQNWGTKHCYNLGLRQFFGCNSILSQFSRARVN